MAADVMRVRLHLREIRVLEVITDTPQELRVRVESSVRRPRCVACGFSVGGCMSAVSARYAIWKYRVVPRCWCGCGAGSIANTVSIGGQRTIPSSTTN